VTSKINAHASTNNAHADIRAQVFAATTNVNALTIAATNATEAAHAATVQANAAILKNTQQDADISYLYASNANTMAIANLANTRAQAANVTNDQNRAAIASVSNLTVAAQATANAAVSGVTAVSNLVIGVKALNENAITNEADQAALSALASYAATNKVTRLSDSSQPSRYFMEIVNSTGTVFEVTGPFTNLMVTLSEDFEETTTHTRPAWTNNAFPFTESQWAGRFIENIEGNADYYCIEGSAGAAVLWADTSETLPAYLTLISGDGAGTATVSVGDIYYTTNAIKHLATEAELEAAKAACGVVLTNTVNAATNALMPYARTLYGDLATTNDAGYAAFNATNAAASSYSEIIPTSFIGSNTNTFRYRFNSLRKFGAVTNTAWFVKSGFGAGIKSVSTLVSVKDASGNVLSQSSSQPLYLSNSSSPSSVTNVFTMPDNVYSGTLDVACIAVSTNASFSVRLYSGAQYTNMLTFSEAPTAYATHTELRSLRAEIPAIVMSNSVPQTIVRSVSVSSTNILVSSANAVYYVALTNAANVGFDFSSLSLGGTKRADITAVIDCLNTQALYSVINTNLFAMDFPWEPTVTGRYELAVSSDGVRTKVVQNSPSMCFFAPALIVVDFASTSYGALFTTLMPSGTLSRDLYIANENNPRELAFLRLAMSFNWPEVNGQLSFVCGSAIIGAFTELSSVTNSVYAYPSGVFGYRPAYIPMRPAAAVGGFALPTRLVRVMKDVDDSRATVISSATIRRMNALERAAYNAGAYPAAFRLDY